MFCRIGGRIGRTFSLKPCCFSLPLPLDAFFFSAFAPDCDGLCALFACESMGQEREGGEHETIKRRVRKVLGKRRWILERFTPNYARRQGDPEYEVIEPFGWDLREIRCSQVGEGQKMRRESEMARKS